MYLTADILTIVLQKCSMSSPLPNIWILPKPLNSIGCHGNRKAKFVNKFSKIVSSEAIRGMKLKLCRNVHSISFNKSGISCWYCSCAFVAMATWNFHWLIVEKMKIGLYRYLIADILTNDLQKYSLNSPLPNILFLSISLNLIGCYCNRKATFPLKIISSEAIRGIKLKLYRNVC